MERVNKVKFPKYETKEEIMAALERAEDDIENGRVIPAAEVFKRMEEKYGF